MSSKKKRFTEEFKQEAIKLAESLGNTLEAARQLGLSDNIIHKWRRELNSKLGADNSGKPLSEKDLEIQKLRKENSELKKVNHILKAAAAFFSLDHLK